METNSSSTRQTSPGGSSTGPPAMESQPPPAREGATPPIEERSPGDRGGEDRPRSDRSGFQRLLHDALHRRHRQRQAVGALFAFLVAFTSTPTTLWLQVGAAFLVLGIAVRMWASGIVKKDKVLAVSGPYAYVRHPLYVGNQLIALGLCLASGLWWSWPLYAVVYALYYPPAIRQEDKKLERLFGDQWRAWRARTWALWPRAELLGASPAKDTDGGWSFGQSLRQNGEPIYAAVLCFLLWVMWGRLPGLS